MLRLFSVKNKALGIRMAIITIGFLQLKGGSGVEGRPTNGVEVMRAELAATEQMPNVGSIPPVRTVEVTNRPCNLDALPRLKDERYCDKYYVCSNGTYVGLFCPIGMAFDYGLQECHLKDKVDCSKTPEFAFGKISTSLAKPALEVGPILPTRLTTTDGIPTGTTTTTTTTQRPTPSLTATSMHVTPGQQIISTTGPELGNLITLQFGARITIPHGSSIFLPPGSRIQIANATSESLHETSHAVGGVSVTPTRPTGANQTGNQTNRIVRPLAAPISTQTTGHVHRHQHASVRPLIPIGSTPTDDLRRPSHRHGQHHEQNPTESSGVTNGSGKRLSNHRLASSNRDSSEPDDITVKKTSSSNRDSNEPDNITVKKPSSNRDSNEPDDITVKLPSTSLVDFSLPQQNEDNVSHQFSTHSSIITLIPDIDTK